MIRVSDQSLKGKLLMEKLKLNKNHKAYLYTLLFTVIIVAFLIKTLHIYPFGDHSFIYSDGDQYFGYYGYLQSTFFSKSNIFYSWSKTLGDGFLGSYAYYAASPFNFILLFFKSDLMLGVNFIALLKIIFTAMNFCFLLNDYDPDNNVLIKGLFSTSYAFIGYTVFFAWNASWMDGVLSLPLLVVGMKRMIQDDRNALYIIVLTFNLISNFYVGYMLGLSTVIFYFIYLIEKRGKFFPRLKKSIFKYLFCTIISVGLACFMLVPAYFGLPHGRRVSIIQIIKNFHFNFKAIDFFPMFYTGAANLADQADNMPIVFIGIVQFVLLISFFVNSKIKERKKIIVAFIFLIFFFSFQLSAINIAWHGFSENVWFNYRYSFIFSFVLMFIAYQSYNDFSTDSQDVMKTIAIFLFITAIVFYPDRTNFTGLTIIFDVIVGSISILIIYTLHLKDRNKKILQKAVLTFFVLFDFCGNSYSSMAVGVNSTSVRNYQSIKNNYNRLASGIHDDGFFRIAHQPEFGRNDASLYNYAGMADYASTTDYNAQKLAQKFGIEHITTWRWSSYNNNAPKSTDDILGIRYLIEPDTGNDKNYQVVSKTGDSVLYKNNDAISLIYPVESFVENKVEVQNDFTFMNSYWKCLSESDYGDVFSIIKPVIQKNKLEDGTYLISLHIDNTNGENERLYLQLPNSLDIKIMQKNKDGLSPITYNLSQDIYYIGKKNNADIILEVKGDIDENQIYCAVENEDAEKHYLADSEKTPIMVNEISSSKLEFKASDKRDQLYASSIPYDTHWIVKANGKQIDTENDGGFLAFKLKKGTHDITMQYYPKGFILGCLMTGISMLIIVSLRIIRKQKNKRKLI